MSVLPRPPDDVMAGLAPAVAAYLAVLEALVIVHQERIAALEARRWQDSSTSSRPPSSAPPKTQAQRRGGPPGQPGQHRELPGDERAGRVEGGTPARCGGGRPGRA